MTDLAPRPASPTFSIPAILAVVCAIGSFYVGSGLLTLLLAGAAIVFGLLGFLISLSPAKRGGILSFISIGAGAIGLIVGIVRIIRYVANGV
jgi:hypothetical protein